MLNSQLNLNTAPIIKETSSRPSSPDVDPKSPPLSPTPEVWFPLSPTSQTTHEVRPSSPALRPNIPAGPFPQRALSPRQLTRVESGSGAGSQPPVSITICTGGGSADPDGITSSMRQCSINVCNSFPQVAMPQPAIAHSDSQGSVFIDHTFSIPSSANIPRPHSSRSMGSSSSTSSTLSHVHNQAASPQSIHSTSSSISGRHLPPRALTASRVMDKVMIGAAGIAVGTLSAMASIYKDDPEVMKYVTGAAIGLNAFLAFGPVKSMILDRTKK